MAQILDVIVPLVALGGVQDRVLQQIEEQAFVDVTEQVISVPKISSPSRPPLRATQLVEHLVEVPMPETLVLVRGTDVAGVPWCQVAHVTSSGPHRPGSLPAQGDIQILGKAEDRRRWWSSL